MQAYDWPVNAESARIRQPGLPWPVLLALLGGFAECASVAWELAWQRTVGQVTAMSPSHLLLLAGVMASLLAALGAVPLRTGVQPQRGVLAVGLIVAGDVLAAIAGLRDVRIEPELWNTPHLFVAFGLATSLFGWAIVARAPGRLTPPGTRFLPYWLFLSLLELVVWFALDGYVLESTLDIVVYMCVAAVVLLPAMVVVGADAAGELGALKLTTVTVLLGWLVVLSFGRAGWRGPDSAPWLLIGAALVVDLDWYEARRTSWISHAARTGAGFALLLVVALQVSTPTPPPWLVEPFDQSFQRPWTRFVEGAVIVSAIPSMLSALLGRGLAGLLLQAGDR